MSRQIGMVDVLFEPTYGACSFPREALAEMDAAGVAVGILSQCKRWSCERQYLCVDTRLEDVRRFLGESIRFAGLAGYNPFDAAESVREMEAARALGFRGAYLHLGSFGLRLNDERVYPLFAKCCELAQPAVVQVPLSEPELARTLERIGCDFPEVALAVAHPQPSAEMFAVCEGFPGLAFVLDTAALTWMTTKRRSLLDDPRIVERCLWGSNGAALAATAAGVMAIDLPLETLEAIVRTNTLRFFAAQPPAHRPRTLSDEVLTAER